MLMEHELVGIVETNLIQKKWNVATQQYMEVVVLVVLRIET
jgi:hypothetical protein